MFFHDVPVNSWVAVVYNDEWFPGNCQLHLIENNYFVLNAMHDAIFIIVLFFKLVLPA